MFERTKKIGNQIAIWGGAAVLVSCIHVALAADVEVTADVDRTQITLDDSVSLKIKIRVEGGDSPSDPRFSAPDFQLVNQWTNNVFVESYYENGRIGMRNTRDFVKALKPLKTGDLKISGIQVSLNGQVYKAASDIFVHVLPAGAGTPPPKGYGGAGVGLRGAGKQVSNRNLILRAEIDKPHAYKGEQVIVSYYLYTRVRAFNIAVEKWPTLNGFLREDLETPVMNPSQRLNSERVTLDGVYYQRSLLVRYAAYPLQEGKLKIDPLALRFNYYPNQGSAGFGNDDDDPFLQFFQSVQARPGNERSEPITVDVLPLPEEGRPNSFSGGVGDFSVTSAVDKYDVRANDALTLTVKVEGRGNLAAIEEPKAKWPDNVELYDSKGHAKSGVAGVGEKVFEFLLIPRTPGKMVLPPLEFSFFDPVNKKYITRTTEPIQINVQDGGPNSRGQTTARVSSPSPQTKSEVHDLRPPEVDANSEGTPPIWRWLYWAAIGAFGFFAGLISWDVVKKGRQNAKALLDSKAKAHAKSWDKMKANARAAVEGSQWSEVTETYELLSQALFDALERLYPIGVRALPRSELRELLVAEKGLAEPLWQRIEKVLEHAELVRFATSFGAVSEGTARAELSKWVEEAQSLVRILEREQV